MKTAAFAGAILLAFAAGLAPAGAVPTTVVDLSQTALTFTSPGDEYGPLHLTSLTLQRNVGASTFGGEIDYGTQESTLVDSSGAFAAVNDTQNWSDSFYSFVQIGAGTADPYPTFTAYVEGNFKTLRSRRLVLSVGLGSEHYASGFGGQLLSVGGEFYWPKFVAGLRALVTQNTSSPTVLGGLATVEYDPTTRSSIVGTLQFGQQNYLSTALALPPSRADYRGYAATLTVKQNLSPAVGVSLGGVLQQQHDAVTGLPVYTARGIILGVYVMQ
jgi:YaiO family outer membrane protein